MAAGNSPAHKLPDDPLGERVTSWVSVQNKQKFSKSLWLVFHSVFFIFLIFGPELGHMLIPVTFSTVRCELRMPQILLRPVVYTIHTSLKLVFSWEGGRGNGCWVATKSVHYTVLAVLRAIF